MYVLKLPNYNYGIIYFGVIYLFERQNIYISAGSIPTDATALLIWSQEQGCLGHASLVASMLWVEYNIVFYLI